MTTATRPLTTDPAADRALCVGLMPHVSRTFALAIRFLPADLEYSVLVAYLLCRVADTIEDSPVLPPAVKRRLLEHFGACLVAEHPDTTPLRDTFAAGASHDERLAREADCVLREFHRLPATHQTAIHPWVREMCAGMADFAETTDAAAVAPGRLRVLPSLAALDRYCYYVAGTVGHLLTGLFRLRFRRADPARDERLEALATSFGLGLQLTNIVKDATEDRRRGWSFVPRELFAEAGITPEDLCDPTHRAEGRRVLDALIAKARVHLDDAIEYCTTLPHEQYGIRVFCLTSVYLAARTLALAARDPRLLESGYKVKITRGEVYRTVAATYAVAPSNALVRRYYRALVGPA